MPDRGADALAAGRCDLVPLNTTVGIVGRSRGLPMVAVYGMAHRTHRWFAVLPESPIRSLADLAGRTVSCDVANLRPLAECALVEEGVNPAEVRFVPWQGSDMEARQMLPELHAGAVDAVFIIDWNHGNLVAEGTSLRRLPSRMLDAITLSSCVWTRSDYLAENPGAIARFGRALAKATLYALHAPHDTIRRMWESFPETAPSRDHDRARDHAVAVLEARLEPMRPSERPGPRWGALHAREIAWWIGQLSASDALGAPVSADESFSDETRRGVQRVRRRCSDPACALRRVCLAAGATRERSSMVGPAGLEPATNGMSPQLVPSILTDSVNLSREFSE